MEKDKNYLVMKTTDDTVREWKCLNVSEVAYLIEPIITQAQSHYSFLGSVDSKRQFWLLKSDVSTVMGKTKFTVIEELKNTL